MQSMPKLLLLKKFSGTRWFNEIYSLFKIILVVIKKMGTFGWTSTMNHRIQELAELFHFLCTIQSVHGRVLLSSRCQLSYPFAKYQRKNVSIFSRGRITPTPPTSTEFRVVLLHKEAFYLILSVQYCIYRIRQHKTCSFG